MKKKKKGHILKLTSSEEVCLVGLTNSDLKVTMQEGLNIKIPN